MNRPDNITQMLQSCTKEELIYLIRHRMIFSVTKRDISLAKWEAMTKKADALLRESLELSKQIQKPKGQHDISGWIAAHKAAQKQFDRGQKLYHRAEKFYDKFIRTDARKEKR